VDARGRDAVDAAMNAQRANNGKHIGKNDLTAGCDSKSTARKKVHRSGVSLLEEHVDHICCLIAEWRGTQTETLVDECFSRFAPWPPHYDDEHGKRHWWADRIIKMFPRDNYGNPTDACRYRDRIMDLRAKLDAELDKRFAFAHKFERMRQLSDMFDYAVRERDVTTHSVRKDARTGATVQFVTKTRREKDLRNALAIIQQLRIESGDDKPQAGNDIPQHRSFAFVVEPTEPGSYEQVGS
jgi:hypothetical protein